MTNEQKAELYDLALFAGYCVGSVLDDWHPAVNETMARVIHGEEKLVDHYRREMAAYNAQRETGDGVALLSLHEGADVRRDELRLTPTGGE